MAKYVAVGPLVFKQKKKGSKSVKTLKPVVSRSERQRAFAYAGNNPERAENIKAERIGRRLAAQQRKEERVRAYFGLRSKGYRAGSNPLADIIGNTKRFTTPKERDQTIPMERKKVKTPYGFAVVGGANERERQTAANQSYENATGIDTSKTFYNRKGVPLKPYGMTTTDTDLAKMRYRERRSRWIKADTARLKKKQTQLQAKSANDIYDRLAGKKPAAAGIPLQVSQARSALVGINKTLNTRARADRKTQAEGMLKALDNLSRLYYGVNSAAKAVVQGERPDHVLEKAGQGLALKRRTESWDVLDAAGVKNKYIKYGLGVPLSFTTDPASYVSLAAAPETGGGSLVALAPKITRLESLTRKASELSKVAEASGKAKHIKRAEKAAKQAAEARTDLLKGIQARTAAAKKGDLPKIDNARRGVSLRVGARLPFSQKFIGVKTSGNASRKIANSKVTLAVPSLAKVGATPAKYETETSRVFKKSDQRKLDAIDRVLDPKSGASVGERAAAEEALKKIQRRAKTVSVERKVADETPGKRRIVKKPIEFGLAGPLRRGRGHLVDHMGPTARPEGVSRKDSRIINNAAPAANEMDSASGPLRKDVQQWLDSAMKSEEYLDIGRLERIFRRRNVVKKTRKLSKNLAHKYDAGEDIGSIGEFLDKHFADLLKEERAAGLDIPAFVNRGGGDAKKYLPRYWKSEVDRKFFKKSKKIRMVEDGVGGYATPGGVPDEFGEVRGIRKTLRALESSETAGDPHQFVHDLSGVTAKRTADSKRAIASKKFNDAIVSTGRKAEKGEGGTNRGESIYKYADGKLTKVKEASDGDNFYMLKDAVVRRADELRGGPKNDAVGLGKWVDRQTGRWKGSVTVAWPGYYLRNLVGDTLLGRQAGTDAKSMIDSARINRANKKAQKVRRSGRHITHGADPDAALKKLTLKINGKTYTAKELEDLAAEHAAISTGRHGSEVAQLVGRDAFSATNRAQRMNVRLENLNRRATFLADMKRGNSADDAAAFVRREHYDYGTRTEFQKQARRVIPFFSWWDLNTRKQLRNLVTRPGKMTEIYHVMNGAASAAGFEDYRDYLSQLPAGQQKGLPIPIVTPFKNKDGSQRIENLQFGNVLSELRGGLTKTPKRHFNEAMSRGNPLLTLPTELWAGKSAFYNDAIAPDYNQTTVAPAMLKGSVGKRGVDTNVEKILNILTGGRGEILEKQSRKTGKKGPEWDKNIDYTLRKLGPWANVALNALAPKGEVGPWEKSLPESITGFTGVNATQFIPEKGQLDKLYAQKNKLDKLHSKLNNSRVTGGKTRAKAIQKRINHLNNEISEIEKKAGYKLPLNTQGGKKKSKSKGNEFEDDFSEFEGSGKKGKNPFEDDFSEFEDSPKKAPKKPSVAKKVKAAAVKSGMNKSQAQIAATIVSIGKKRGVPKKHILAALATGRVESNFANSAAMTDHDSQGWRQERKSLYKNPTNLKASINRFYDETAQADRNGMSAGELAANVQRPAAQYRGRYAQHVGEAEMLLASAKGGKVKKVIGPFHPKFAVASGAARSGAKLTPLARATAKTMGSFTRFKPTVTTSTNHSQMTTSGNVSDHWSGNGMDFGIGGDIRQGGGDEKKGNAIAAAALQTAGMSKKEARAAAKKGGVFNVVKDGTRYQIIWKSNTGGNHFNHVHVGVKSEAGADSSSYSGGGGYVGGGSGAGGAVMVSDSPSDTSSRTSSADPIEALLSTKEGRYEVYKLLTTKRRKKGSTLDLVTELRRIAGQGQGVLS